VPLRRQAYSPVSRAYRDGVQVAEAEWALGKRTPSFAMRSIFGVARRFAP